MSKKDNAPKTLKGFTIVVILAAVGYFLFPRNGDADSVTFKAIRGPMNISVIEGGTIEATQSQVIKSQVEGREGVTILKLIEEGYQVTEDDVAEGLVLVELDSSLIVERIRSQETEVQGELANVMEYVKQREIRESKNISSIKTASVQAKFAKMDFMKYLGEAAAEKILKEIGLTEETVDAAADEAAASGMSMFSNSLLEAANTNADGKSEAALLGGLDDASTLVENWEATNEKDLLPEIRDFNVDFSVFTQDGNEELLGDGDARQELRKLKDAVLIAEAEFALTKKTYEGGIRLAEKGFMTPNELQNKKIEFEKSKNSVASAKANLDLFKTYSIQKEAEQYLLGYEQALMTLSRAKKDAIAEMADSVGDLNRAQRGYRWEKWQLDDLRRQYAACTIKAERPGLVVYGDGRDRWAPDEVIREGVKVRQRQAIITIPDMRHMAVKVRIHESQVKRVKNGMPVEIKIEAEPSKRLTGIVSSVGVLPDSENRRFNPDQKVYKTTIEIDGVHEWIKPGMAAEADISINVLENVVQVPLQSIYNHKGVNYCCVDTSSGIEVRKIEVEDYNNRFAAIKSGLKEGEIVHLQRPQNLDLSKLEEIPESVIDEPTQVTKVE